MKQNIQELHSSSDADWFEIVYYYDLFSSDHSKEMSETKQISCAFPN